MAKRCVICEKTALFSIKGTSNYYCTECAEENFSNVNLLERLE